MYLYNSATHKKELFETHTPGKVEMYTANIAAIKRRAELQAQKEAEERERIKAEAEATAKAQAEAEAEAKRIATEEAYKIHIIVLYGIIVLLLLAVVYLANRLSKKKK